jgi:hypothetical protein
VFRLALRQTEGLILSSAFTRNGLVIWLAPTSMRSIKAASNARWRVPRNSGQLSPISPARVISRCCADGSASCYAGQINRRDSDHRGRGRLLNRRATIGQIEAHHPEHPGAARVVPEYPEIVYQVTRGGTAALPAPIIKGADILLPLEPVGADRVKRVRQIKLMRQARRCCHPRRPSNLSLAD